VIALLAGCGRIAFDPLRGTENGDGGGTDVTSPDASALPLCFADNFDDFDVSDWNLSGEWTVQPGGPDLSPMLQVSVDSPVGATHPMLLGVTTAIVEYDLRMDAPADGDAFVHFMAPGWTDPSNDSKYRVALYPVGSDNPTDNIRRVVSPTNTTLAMMPTVLAAQAWQHVVIAFELDHSISIRIEGAQHFSSPPDAQLAGPYDVVFDFFKAGAIDNVRVLCD
jgi:hypothetical protein